MIVVQVYHELEEPQGKYIQSMAVFSVNYCSTCINSNTIQRIPFTIGLQGGNSSLQDHTNQKVEWYSN